MARIDCRTIWQFNRVFRFAALNHRQELLSLLGGCCFYGRVHTGARAGHVQHVIPTNRCRLLHTSIQLHTIYNDRIIGPLQLARSESTVVMWFAVISKSRALQHPLAFWRVGGGEGSRANMNWNALSSHRLP